MDIKDLRRNMFITQPDYPDSFAIVAGEEFTSEDGKEQLLLCYFNPTHFEQDEAGKWHMGKEVFSCEVGTEQCDWTIPNEDVQYWRECTDAEVNRAVKLLGDKRIAWDRGSLRKMAAGETLNFGTRPLSQQSANPNPYYNQRNLPATTRPTTTTKKYITLKVDEQWEQKKPVAIMTIKRRELLLELCKKPLYGFPYISHGVFNGQRGGQYSGTYGGEPLYQHRNVYENECEPEWY